MQFLDDLQLSISPAVSEYYFCIFIPGDPSKRALICQRRIGCVVIYFRIADIRIVAIRNYAAVLLPPALPNQLGSAGSVFYTDLVDIEISSRDQILDDYCVVRRDL